ISKECYFPGERCQYDFSHYAVTQITQAGKLMEASANTGETGVYLPVGLRPFFNRDGRRCDSNPSAWSFLPVSKVGWQSRIRVIQNFAPLLAPTRLARHFCNGLAQTRSAEHTSDLQSLRHLGCRLLLEIKRT